MLRDAGDRQTTGAVSRTARCSRVISRVGAAAAAGRGRLLTWLAGKTSSVGDRLFLADDRRAIGLGWQVTPGRWGLSRTYRDRRFDGLARRDR